MGNLISVICTVKNGENTISNTIDSVIKQDFEKWEFIIIDDGSSDGTENILKEYASKDKRIKIYFSGGIGRGRALNKAIELSSGKYIANIDADDLMHPEKLKTQIEVFNNNRDIFLVSTEFDIIYDEERPKWKRINNKDIKFEYVGKKILIRNTISHPSVLMNKGELIKIGKYNENRLSQVDYELWLRAFLMEKKMVTIRENLVAKRIHQNQSYENKRRIKYVYNSMLLQIKYILKSRKYLMLFPFPIASFFMSLLPFKVRRNMVKLITR